MIALKKALALIDHQKTGDEHKEFGTQNLYDDETLLTWAREQHLIVENILGIRSFSVCHVIAM